MDLLNRFISEKWPFRGQVSHCCGPRFPRRRDQPGPGYRPQRCVLSVEGRQADNGALLCGEGMDRNIKIIFVDKDILLLLFEAILEIRSGSYF